MTNAVLTGLVLGGMYALIAMGLTLQYGVARIMNLSYGEFLIGAAFASYWLFTGWALNPLAGLAFVIPISFGISYLLYRVLLTPLVRRARTRDALEVDSILATFGMMFIVQGIMLTMFGGAYFSYSFLAVPVMIVGEVLALNRLIAFGLAVVVGLALYLTLTRTRIGTSIRAVAVDPIAAQLVAIDVTKTSALAFALGGAVTATGGALISTFLTLDASTGVIFTLKALVIVIMGGVGDVRGTIVAALLLGLLETFVARLIDPGLTLAAAYLLFVVILLFRPQGLFGRPTT